eukprot:jgi/Mesvir1/12628/Mv09323-RA.1
MEDTDTARQDAGFTHLTVDRREAMSSPRVEGDASDSSDALTPLESPGDAAMVRWNLQAEPGGDSPAPKSASSSREVSALADESVEHAESPTPSQLLSLANYDFGRAVLEEIRGEQLKLQKVLTSETEAMQMKILDAQEMLRLKKLKLAAQREQLAALQRHLGHQPKEAHPEGSTEAQRRAASDVTQLKQNAALESELQLLQDALASLSTTRAEGRGTMACDLARSAQNLSTLRTESAHWKQKVQEINIAVEKTRCWEKQREVDSMDFFKHVIQSQGGTGQGQPTLSLPIASSTVVGLPSFSNTKAQATSQPRMEERPLFEEGSVEISRLEMLPPARRRQSLLAISHRFTELGKVASQFQSLLSCVKLAAALDADTILGELLRTATEICDTEAATVLMVDHERHIMWPRAPRHRPHAKYEVGRGITGAAAETGQAMRAADAEADMLYDPEVDRREGLPAGADDGGSIMCVPFSTDEEGFPPISYVLKLRNKHSGGAFSAQEQAITQQLASQVGVALRNAAAFEETSRALRCNRQLAAATCDTCRVLSAREVAVRVQPLLSQLLGAQAAVLYLLDKETHELFRADGDVTDERISGDPTGRRSKMGPSRRVTAANDHSRASPPRSHSPSRQTGGKDMVGVSTRLRAMAASPAIPHVGGRPVTGVIGTCITTGGFLRMPDASLDRNFDAGVDTPAGVASVRNMLCAAIVIGHGAPCGLLQVVNKKPGPGSGPMPPTGGPSSDGSNPSPRLLGNLSHRRRAAKLASSSSDAFTPIDEELLTLVTRQVAVALQNIQQFASVVARTSSTIVPDVACRMHEIAHEVMAQGREAVGAETAKMFLLDAGADTLRVPLGGDYTYFPLGRGIAGHVAARGEVLNVREVKHSPKYDEEVDRHSVKENTMICLPMYLPGGAAIANDAHAANAKTGGHGRGHGANNAGANAGSNAGSGVAAVLQVVNKRKAFFERDDEHALRKLAGQAAFALRNGLLGDDMARTARCDAAATLAVQKLLGVADWGRGPALYELVETTLAEAMESDAALVLCVAEGAGGPQSPAGDAAHAASGGGTGSHPNNGGGKGGVQEGEGSAGDQGGGESAAEDVKEEAGAMHGFRWLADTPVKPDTRRLRALRVAKRVLQTGTLVTESKGGKGGASAAAREAAREGGAGGAPSGGGGGGEYTSKPLHVLAAPLKLWEHTFGIVYFERASFRSFDMRDEESAALLLLRAAAIMHKVIVMGAGEVPTGGAGAS